MKQFSLFFLFTIQLSSQFIQYLCVNSFSFFFGLVGMWSITLIGIAIFDAKIASICFTIIETWNSIELKKKKQENESQRTTRIGGKNESENMFTFQ